MKARYASSSRSRASCSSLETRARASFCQITAPQGAVAKGPPLLYKMECCTSADAKYVDMEMAAKQKADGAERMLGNGAAAAAPPAKPASRLPTILGGLGLLMGIVSLIFSIYASTVARKVRPDGCDCCDRLFGCRRPGGGRTGGGSTPASC
jgi:hypothetical protein